MKFLPVLALALMAYTDVADAWSLKVYKKPNFKGAYSYMNGKSKSGGKCRKLSALHGPNMSGISRSKSFKSYDTKANSLCSVAFYHTKNCSGGKGDAGEGYGTFTWSGSAKDGYYSFYIKCGKLKRRDLEGGEWNATEAALADIDLSDEYDHEFDDVEGLEWEEDDDGDFEEGEGFEE
ncbi:uncharacterized protein DNG_04547 [Cephalotrichum gorgonifer]|uniref:Uncharacterized protein n=1 Tax=Cephalotrichum gorgonifer TaxID=2041049 RepID=A0AAE8SV05_9PEZI|nr:uncharacterized protein DNG_04547 [Cephalotrichum gorgonifer]